MHLKTSWLISAWDTQVGTLFQCCLTQAKGLESGSAHASSRDAAAAVARQCRVAKAIRPPAKPTEREESETPFELVFIDWTGPFVVGCDESVWAFGATCDRTLGGAFACFVVPTHARDGRSAAAATAVIADSAAALAASAGLDVGGGGPWSIIKTIQSDNAQEFRAGDFAKWCKAHGVTQRFTTKYLHQNNSLIEGAWRDIQNGTRALLLNANLPKDYWPHAIQHYVYISNRTPRTGRLQGASPFKVLFGMQPNLATLRVFGCVAYQYLHYQQRKDDNQADSSPVEDASPGNTELVEDFSLTSTQPVRRRLKLANRAMPMLYISQSENSTAYKLVDPANPKKIQKCRMVIFDEAAKIQHATDPGMNEQASYLSTDFDMAIPTGAMLEREALAHEPFTVEQDQEVYAIFHVRSNTYPVGIWVSAEYLLDSQPNNCNVVMEYLQQALLPGCINPYYPLFVECKVKEWYLRNGARRTKKSEQYQRCLVVGYDPNITTENNILVVTLDGTAAAGDIPRASNIPRAEARVTREPKVALSASKILDDQTITEPKNLRQAQRAPDRVPWQEAMQKELDSLHSKGTFEYITKLPPGKKAILTAFKLEFNLNLCGYHTNPAIGPFLDF